MVSDNNGSSEDCDEYFDNLYKIDSEQFKKEVIEMFRQNLKLLNTNQDLFALIRADLKKFKIASFMFTIAMFRRTDHEPSEKERQMIAEMISINPDEISSQTESPLNVVPYEIFKQYKKAKDETEEV